MKSSIQIVSLCLIGCLGATASLAEQHKVKSERMEKTVKNTPKLKKVVPSMGGMSGQTAKDVKVAPKIKKRAPAATPINLPKEAKKTPIIKNPVPADSPMPIPKTKITPSPGATPINLP